MISIDDADAALFLLYDPTISKIRFFVGKSLFAFSFITSKICSYFYREIFCLKSSKCFRANFWSGFSSLWPCFFKDATS